MQPDRPDLGLTPVRHLSTEAGRVAYQPLGDPDGRGGPPVVLLPGLTDGLSPVTSPQTRAQLADLPFSLRGHAGLAVSYPEPLPEAATTAELARATALALERLVERPAVVVAHSLGGMVAQHLAVDRPDLVARLVLSGTAGRADDRLRAVLTRWEELVRAGRFDELARDGQETARPGPNREGTDREDREVEAPPPALVARHLTLSGACGAHDALDRLGALRCPVTVLAAAQDIVVHVDLVEELAHAVPQATLHVAAGVGHGLPEQEPRWYGRRVEAALDAAGRSGGDR